LRPAEPDVRVCADAHDLTERAAAATATTIADAVHRHGRCLLVFSGGQTPRGLYERLASTYRDQIPWSQVHAFWGDERYVEPDAAASNYRMVRESLLDRVPLPPRNVHPIPTGAASPEAAARDYERAIRAEVGGTPAFDLVLLGLGEEGHTASLFPHSAALEETARWVVAVNVPAEPPTRLTLTLPAITAAARIFVLVSGVAKAAALARVLDPASSIRDYPAAALRAAAGRVTWWVDRDAAKDSTRAGL
jgi:6-phosphogluconolactonase